MPFQDLGRRRTKPRRPKRNAPAFAGAGDPPIRQKGQRIDAATMPARDGTCLPGAHIPKDHGMIEAGRDNMLPIGQGQNGADRASMPRQILRPCRL